MPTGGSVKAVRTTGEHVASVGGSYGCGEGGERRAVLCECFPVDFRPFVLFSDFFTQNLYGQKISFCFPNVDFRSAWICIRMDIFRFPFFRCFTKLFFLFYFPIKITKNHDHEKSRRSREDHESFFYRFSKLPFSKRR